jgi:hypothetical protein
MQNRSIASLFRAAGTCAALAVMLAACGHKDVSTQSSGAGAGGAAPAGPTVASSGSAFYGKLDVPISTKTSKNGDAFTLTQEDKLFHNDPALHGAIIDGHVDGVVAAGPMRNPAMTIVFDDIRLADGTKEPVNVILVQTHQFDPASHHLRTVGLMLGGAIAGHIAAAHSGHKHGGMMGAVGGYAASQALKTDVSVPAGSIVELRFKSPVTDASASPAGN